MNLRFIDFYRFFTTLKQNLFVERQNPRNLNIRTIRSWQSLFQIIKNWVISEVLKHSQNSMFNILWHAIRIYYSPTDNCEWRIFTLFLENRILWMTDLSGAANIQWILWNKGQFDDSIWGSVRSAWQD